MPPPQMRNLGFQFELTPDKAYLSCARTGMRKMVLKTATRTHLILDLQDVAWYMGQVNFKTPQVKSFFSHHDHFEFTKIAVQQDDQKNEEALVTGDYWQVDGLRRELIRHHKDETVLSYMKCRDLRLLQFQKTNSWMRERETHIEYQKSRKKVLYKDNWRTEEKRFSGKMEDFLKGKTVYKIKNDHVIAEDVVRSDSDRQAKLFRGNIDDVLYPESASSSKPVSVQKKPSSQARSC